AAPSSSSPAASARLQPAGLQSKGIVARANALKVASGGVTPSARGCEIGLALFGIAGEDVLEGVGGAVSGGVGLDVEPGHEIGDLGLGEIGPRHPLIGAAIADHGRDEDALFIVENEHGTDEVGGTGTASPDRTMAACAIGGEERHPTS